MAGIVEKGVVYYMMRGTDLLGHRHPNLLFCGRGQNHVAIGQVPPGVDGWLGSPFLLKNYSVEVCLDMFEVIFLAQLRFHQDFRDELYRWRKLAETERVYVSHWCVRPDRCHARTVIKFLLGFYDEEIKLWESSTWRRS